MQVQPKSSGRNEFITLRAKNSVRYDLSTETFQNKAVLKGSFTKQVAQVAVRIFRENQKQKLGDPELRTDHEIDDSKLRIRDPIQSVNMLLILMGCALVDEDEELYEMCSSRM